MSGGIALEHDWFPRPLPASVAAGERSWIYSSFAFLHCRTERVGAVRIGRDTGIYHGTFFELGPEADVEIGDYCALVGAIVCTNGRVRIGDHTFIAHEVVLADGSWAVPPRGADSLLTSAATEKEKHLPPRWRAVPPPQGGIEARGIELGENCWVGMRAVLLAGTKLAEGCVVGAGAVVNFAAPPFSIIAGNPARVVGTAR